MARHGFHQDVAAPATRARLLAAGRSVLLFVVLLATGHALLDHWGEVSRTIGGMSMAYLVPAILVLPLAIMSSTMSWQVMLDEIGEPVGVLRGGQIFLVGQLGKYLPGSVWAYLLQVELGRRAGLARARVFAATLMSIVVLLVAAVLASSLALPGLSAAEPSLRRLFWLYVLLPVATLALHPRMLTLGVSLAYRALGRPMPEQSVRKRAVLASFAWVSGSYLLLGVHLWLLGRSVGGLGPETVPLAVGTMAAAMLAGLFFFVLPSGVGVREAVIVAALTPLLGTGVAIALAAVSRLCLTVADVVTAGLATALALRERRRLKVPDVVAADVSDLR